MAVRLVRLRRTVITSTGLSDPAQMGAGYELVLLEMFSRPPFQCEATRHRFPFYLCRVDADVAGKRPLRSAWDDGGQLRHGARRRRWPVLQQQCQNYFHRGKSEAGCGEPKSPAVANGSEYLTMRQANNEHGGVF